MQMDNAPTITESVRPYPAKPLLSHTLVLENTPQQLADMLGENVHPAFRAAVAAQASKPTQHERIAAKLEALYAEVDGLIGSLPEQYLKAAFATADALDAARAAWGKA